MSNRKGLSLIEIIIAMMILAGVMAGIAGIFFAGKRHVMHSRDRMSGGELGKAFFEPLQMSVRADTWDAAGNPLNLVGATDGAIVKVDNFDYTPEYEVTAVNAGATPKEVRRVKVKIKWTED